MKKITTLIPAYKTEFLGELLLCLNNQTYKNFSVIISDDSPGGRITELLQSQTFKPLTSALEITIVEGPRKGGFNNVIHLLKIGGDVSEALHILFDDDIIYPRFYDYHIGIHQTPDIVCSVSRRWTSAASGMPTGMLPVPPYVEQNMARALLLDSDRLFKSTVPYCNNWLGEFSNFVFTKEMIPLIMQQEMGGICYFGLDDIGILLQATLTKKVVFLQDYLGFFRRNPHQHTAQSHNPIRKAAYLCWCALAIASLYIGKLSGEEAYLTFKRMEGMIRHDYPSDKTMQPFVSLFSMHSHMSDDLIKKFCALWQDFLQTNDLFIAPHSGITRAVNHP